MVVALSETGEIVFGVIGFELAMGSGGLAHDVSDRGANPIEEHRAGCPAAQAGAGRAVVMACVAEGGPAGESVGYGPRVGDQPALCATCGLAPTETLDRDQIGLARAALRSRSRRQSRTASCRVRPGPACYRSAPAVNSDSVEWKIVPAGTITTMAAYPNTGVRPQTEPVSSGGPNQPDALPHGIKVQKSDVWTYRSHKDAQRER